MNDFARHFVLNANAIWLMAKRNSAGAGLVEENPSAIKTSVTALAVSFLLTLIFDYIAFPSEVADGYVAEGISQNAYVVLNLLINVVSTLIGYYVLYLILRWMERDQRFAAVFVCYNWIGLIASLAILPLVSVLSNAEGAGFGIFLITIAAVFYIAIISLHFLTEIDIGPAIGISVASFLAQIFVAITLTSNFGLLVLN